MLKIKMRLESEVFATLCAIMVIGAFILFAFYIAPLPSYPSHGYKSGVSGPTNIEGGDSAAASQQGNPGLSLSLKQQQGSSGNREPSSDQASEKETNRKLAEFTQDLVLVGVAQAVILGISVIALGVQAAFLWFSTRESTRQHIVTNRAFVFLRSFGFMPAGRTTKAHNQCV
jgi:hypothetical protein